MLRHKIPIRDHTAMVSLKKVNFCGDNKMIATGFKVSTP